MSYLEGIRVALRGVGATLSITAVAVVIGVALGLLIALMRMSKKKVLRGISTVYIEMLRGTPLLVQALLVYFGVPMLLKNYGIDFTWNALVAGMIVCGINSSAYVAEIIRSGIQAVDKGQTEAAKSLGMSHAQTMRLVVIPQAFKIVIPALGNEFITLIKETAVLSAISITDITRASMLWASAKFLPWQAYLGTAVVYMMLTIPLSKIMGVLERKMSQDVSS